jgi:hypothetical protein
MLHADELTRISTLIPLGTHVDHRGDPHIEVANYRRSSLPALDDVSDFADAGRR